jgi:hypothetical protein
MPYIKVREQSDGSTRYTAIVRLRSGKTIVHQIRASRCRDVPQEGLW